MVDVDADPVVVGDVVYAVAYQGRLAAIELRSGRLLWTREFSSYKDLAVRGDILFVVDERGNLWALDRHSGASLWKQDKFIGRRITSPATLGDYVVVGDFEGYVHWLDNDTGRILGRYLADSQGITMPLIALGSRIYVIGNSGLMKAFKADAKDNR
jgi:outer membrane protein assembly factor BamB